MNEQKLARIVLMAQAEELGISDKVKQHEARLAGRFIQQPTKEDLAAYAIALTLVATQCEQLALNAEPKVTSGDSEPAPIEVELQPTQEQINAGIGALWEIIPGAMDQLYQDVDEEERPDLNSDIATFVWQAMIGARNK